jgi:hypothetical protein
LTTKSRPLRLGSRTRGYHCLGSHCKLRFSS